jgi:Tfp pilus assembly protein PilX
VNQRGIALLTGLLLMAAISLLALSATSGMLLQRSMTVNFQENAVALQNAGVASAYAAAWLFSRPVNERESGCGDNCLLPMAIHDAGSLPANPEFESIQWWRINATPAGYNPQTAQTDPAPVAGEEPAFWLIEEIHFESTGDSRDEGRAESQAWYRILSRGAGRNGRSVAVSETIVARPWNGDFQPAVYPPEGPAEAFCDQFESRYACGPLAWRQKR